MPEVHRPSRIHAALPPAPAGSRIGLYGGSFNPPHPGHRHVSLFALKRLRLDAVWWLVTPGNPLKDVSCLPPLVHRMARAAAVAADRRLVVTGLEAAWGTRYTADLLMRLRRRLPHVRFVWIMGSDNLASFHRWDRWPVIAAACPIAIVNRPGFLAAALASPAARALAPYRIDERDAATLAGRRPPAWVFLTGPRSEASSTALRATGASLAPAGGGKTGAAEARPS